MLEFERELAELQDRIQGLKTIPGKDKVRIEDEIHRLEIKGERLLKEIYSHLTPWQKVLVARHPERPKAKDYIHHMITHFVPLAGDRCYGEDVAIIGGIGMLQGHSVVIMGHEKGHDTSSRLAHNFGMAHPEGYRKVIRFMDFAHRFRLPLVMLIDTPGAYAGIGAEERGQAQAIASCLEKSFSLEVPVVSVVIGEGGSGGAIAMATANRIAMLEHSIYSVISPEGCASILWRTSEKKEEAASAQKLTSADLLSMGIIDNVIPEPLGGAHRSRHATMDAVSDFLASYLRSSEGQRNFQHHRRQKFMSMGRNFLKPSR